MSALSLQAAVTLLATDGRGGQAFLTSVAGVCPWCGKAACLWVSRQGESSCWACDAGGNAEERRLEALKHFCGQCGVADGEAQCGCPDDVGDPRELDDVRRGY